MWFLGERSDNRVPPNPVVVDETLARIRSCTIAGFFDDQTPAPGPDATSLDDPALIITMTTRANEPRALAIGAPTPAGTRYASVDRPAPTTLALAGPPPTAFSTAVRSYLATTATDVLPADVGALRLVWADPDTPPDTSSAHSTAGSIAQATRPPTPSPSTARSPSFPSRPASRRRPSPTPTS